MVCYQILQRQKHCRLSWIFLFIIVFWFLSMLILFGWKLTASTSRCDGVLYSQAQSVRDARLRQSVNSVLGKLERLHLNLQGEDAEKLEEIIDSIYGLHDNETPRRSMVLKRNTTETKGLQQGREVTRIKDVCEESYEHKDLTFGYPFFYKGFDMQNCTDVPLLKKIVTIVISFVKSPNHVLKKLPAILSEIQKMYNDVPVIVGIRQDQNATISPHFNHHQIKRFSDTSVEMFVWKKLLSLVRTKYVFLARDVVHWTWHIRLERLIREVNGLQAGIVASSHRTVNGEWKIGCEQSRLRNYTLVYTQGYRKSSHECVYCDYTSSPFLANMTVFKKLTLPDMVNAESGFRSWFLSIKSHNITTVVCPDAMSFIHQRKESSKFMEIAKFHKVEKLVTSSGETQTFSCAEAGTDCSMTTGLALSHCCMNELSTAIKFFMTACKDSGSLCELQEGTLLGAVKLNGILPWERDADLTFSTANFSAIQALAPKFKKAGYNLITSKEPWCCVDGRHAGGVFMLTSDSWSLELNGQHLMDSEKLILEGLKPTYLYLDGQEVAVPASPGLFCRNRYRHEIYKHAQHWMSSNTQDSGWAFYKPGRFHQCPEPGHQACLDQYEADGNIHFRDVLS